MTCFVDLSIISFYVLLYYPIQRNDDNVLRFVLTPHSLCLLVEDIKPHVHHEAN